MKKTALSGKEWVVLLLLVVSALINYFDRTALSVSATNIQRDLHISNEDIGRLHSAFFAAYAICQISFFAGWMVGRFHAGWVLAGGFVVWSGATALTGAAPAFAVIVGLRVLLGIGESITFPAYSRILASEYPEHHRGFANALIDVGTKVGPAIGVLLGGLLVARLGWRVFFFALGGASLLWLAPWIRTMPRGSSAAREDRSRVPSIGAILRQRSLWFISFGQFCANYYWYFLLTWLPAYLEKERHFPKEKMALFAWLPFLSIAVMDVASGWVSDWLIARGNSPTMVRKSFAGVGLGLASIAIGVTMVESDVAAIVILTLGCVAYGLYAPHLFAFTQTIAGPHAAGKWTSFQNGFANMAGILAPWLTGLVVDTTGQFFYAFLLAGCFAVAGAANFVIGVGRVEQVEFK